MLVELGMGEEILRELLNGLIDCLNLLEKIYNR
jgi:hypothetical protein